MSQPQDHAAPPPRRSNGCLWGCLGVVLLAVLAVGGTFLWGEWYTTQGFKSDPALQSAIAAVRHDSTAHDVLGDDIRIESVHSEQFNSVIGEQHSATYSAQLKGSKGEGELHVTMHSTDGKMQIVSMVLTTPDGTRYNLTSKVLTPSPSSI